MIRKSIGAGIVLMLVAVSLSGGLFAAEAGVQDTVVAGNSQFASDFYKELRAQDGNLFPSPLGNSTALAIAVARVAVRALTFCRAGEVARSLERAIDRAETVRRAKKAGIPIWQKYRDGRVIFLQRYDRDGRPVYLTTL